LTVPTTPMTSSRTAISEKEDRDPVRLVLDFQDPVAVLRRAHVRDDADDPHLARRSAGLRDLLGPREVVAGPQHVPQDLEAMPEVPREVRERPLAGRMAGDVPEDPHVRVLVCGLLPEAPERRRDEGSRQARRRGRRLGRNLGRGAPGDLSRAHHVIEGDDERRFQAGFEERLDALDGIALRQEELDCVRLEQGSAIAHERQKFLAHPGGHCGEPVKKPSSRGRDIPRKLKPKGRIG